MAGFANKVDSFSKKWVVSARSTYYVPNKNVAFYGEPILKCCENFKQ